ncbi:hypothetical protein [Asanoa iriomotensis]|uniref:Membrane protein (TIGR02234 family) n=1 Tax=Asanoa iriomotensis TaxID=234613 RepID=A0ABQ4C6V8_9ACTN|nr:hypothetical protein [Asanoa iriomotensis]GIF58517.1 hypothetical protein Air01nite_46120 [Asanoa iriomotensis]
MSEFAPGPDRARPPGTVRISSYLLYAVAVVEVISLIVTLATLSSFRQALSDAYAGTELEGSADTAAVAVAVVVGIIALVIGIGLVVLGFLNLRGKNASRIVTWVVGGLFVLCCGLSAVGNAAGGAVNFESSGDVPDVQGKIDAAMPGWYDPVNVVLLVVPILCVLVALILLALPASNEWFKPRAANWEPPTPGYPVMPGTSYPTPPFPTQGGEPPLPPAPTAEPPETPAPPR